MPPKGSSAAAAIAAALDGQGVLSACSCSGDCCSRRLAAAWQQRWRRRQQAARGSSSWGVVLGRDVTADRIIAIRRPPSAWAGGAVLAWTQGRLIAVVGQHYATMARNVGPETTAWRHVGQSTAHLLPMQGQPGHSCCSWPVCALQAPSGFGAVAAGSRCIRPCLAASTASRRPAPSLPDTHRPCTSEVSAAR